VSGPRLDAATLRQVEAADPTASTWLSANAGSGKTRVLTERVARLLLRGVPPQNILCLTYTKAAASEMQNRLFDRLGGWAMLGDEALAAALARLGAEAPDSAETRARARRLFARAIDTPGGLRIQTIHAFCAAVLRRFPIEAGVSPGFRELDDAARTRLIAEVTGRVAAESPEIVAGVGALVTDESFEPLCLSILGHRDGFAEPLGEGEANRLVGLPAGATEEALDEAILQGLGANGLAAICAALSGAGGATMPKVADALAALAENGPGEGRVEALTRLCLLGEGHDTPLEPKTHNMPTKKAAEAMGALLADFQAMQHRLSEAAHGRRALEVARRTEALHRFAHAFLAAYDAAKAEAGLLDFDDLIVRTEGLLARPGVSDWVLYRLDGEIDHVLVDEAQDTSPPQWRIIERLTQEFRAGAGRTAPGARTIFVVGDPKQSIYSFQGAEPERFGEMQGRIGARGLPLEYSFRSAPEILRVVEETFPQENRAGLGTWTQHRAFRADLPGRVELWPLVEPAPGEDEGDWWEPVDRPGETHHRLRLARQVAEGARAMIDRAAIPDGAGGARRVHAGDILILVQSRGVLFHAVIAACKAEGIDVAGADVLKLGEELAVRDLLALLAFLDLPEDDLSLAAVLRSPLGGWSEAELYDLAQARPEGQTLWAALRGRSSEFSATHRWLSDLRDQTDFLRPYELLERALIRHGGRRRLVARLGQEAEDGIDGLLARALAFEERELPSLTGFLAAQEGEDGRVKRQAEGRGDKLRVMTVHGAKGLESPIVILPDCAEQPTLRQYRDRVLRHDGKEGAALWAPSKGALPRNLRAQAYDPAIAARVEEAQRLLYVAMTRAETWLVVAASGKLGSRGDSWYEQLRAGLTRAGSAEHPERAGGLLLRAADWPETAPPRSPADAPAEDAPVLPDVPDWALRPAPVPPAAPRALSPSDLGGAKALPGEAGLPEAAALARGSAVHLLLERLPFHPRADWPGIAARLIAPAPLDPAALAEATAVLEAPGLAHVFAPGTLAEVPVAAALPALGGRRVRGTIDRLLRDADRVLAVDFKTNAVVPERPEDVPEGLLRQMGAYAAALSAVYPDRRVETAILWTRGAALMPLPDALTAAALARAHDTESDDPAA
jgi:ATP-dependent helicase/nuclease subunit A